ncbi:hypothetical protein [Microbulbifer rhizosphaerae]|uniref:Uncharacterized protein n=1 Tax=Microbulbifer rhizosphaerae TaxID=1562603 RepID=A0A7W4WFI3_9GAMM|nr:hypothetical protein [Microbulbifer rhizosphaerae]MBB3063290.1 hypothetical protein [Microbulbifer rhizosphaerae]
MADLKLSTILICIQSVQKQIEHFEGLLESETVRDKAEIQELLLSYDQAAENLKEAYISMRSPRSNYPEYESLVKKNL